MRQITWLATLLNFKNLHLRLNNLTQLQMDDIVSFLRLTLFVVLLISCPLVPTSPCLQNMLISSWIPLLHYFSGACNPSWQIVGQRVYDVLKEYPRLRLTHGRKVLEVRPMIDWDKGKAVTFLLESLDKLDVIKGFAPTSGTNSDKDDHNGEQLMEYESQICSKEKEETCS
ncbi:hypothetical protein JHK87_050460 [Glycine soja]|nr:hypothetical protein JHK87_050460 [Glycine soja]